MCEVNQALTASWTGCSSHVSRRGSRLFVQVSIAVRFIRVIWVRGWAGPTRKKARSRFLLVRVCPRGLPRAWAA
jgi:hypothetical protein